VRDWVRKKKSALKVANLRADGVGSLKSIWRSSLSILVLPGYSRGPWPVGARYP